MAKWTEKINDLFEEDEEIKVDKNEEEEISDLDIELVELGMKPEYFDDFKGEIFEEDELTKEAFKHYIKKASEKELKALNRKKIPLKYMKTIDEQKRKANREFDYSQQPLIVLLWGGDGTSKSEQIMKFMPQETTLIFDLEDKLRPLAGKLQFPQSNIINAKKYNELLEEDGPQTLQGIRDIIKKIKKDKINGKGKYAKFKTIAVDGISDIRPYAVLEWLQENPSRVRPSTYGDWGDINDKVRNICFGMINMGIQTGTNIIFTAQISFREDGEIPDCKPWIWHNIHHKFKLYRDNTNHRFYAFCEKSYFDPFFTLDLTDWTHEEKPSLLNMLQDPELLKKYIEESRKEMENLAKSKIDGVFE